MAVTVTFDVPVVAVLLADRVSVELPLPGAAIEVGLKLAVTPEGNPEAESETAELKPPLTVVEMVLLPEAPCAIERLAGDALTVKSGVAAEVTVRLMAVVWVTPPPVAVTVMVVTPVTAVLLAERVSVELPLPGAAIEAGLKLAVTPEGNPEADKETAELKPPLTLVVIVLLPEAPSTIESVAGDAARLKSGCVTVNAMVAV